MWYRSSSGLLVPAPWAWGGNVPLTAAFFNSSTGGAGTIDGVASSQIGDLGVMCWHSWGTTGSTPGNTAVPTGWTEDRHSSRSHNGISVTGIRHKLMSKILDADDFSGGTPVTYTGFSGNTGDRKVLLVFRGNRAFTTKTYHTGGSVVQDTDPGGQACNASGGATPIVTIGAAGVGTGTAAFQSSPFGANTVADATVDLIMGYLVYNSAPADVTVDMSDLGNNLGLSSGWWELQ